MSSGTWRPEATTASSAAAAIWSEPQRWRRGRARRPGRRARLAAQRWDQRAVPGSGRRGSGRGRRGRGPAKDPLLHGGECFGARDMNYRARPVLDQVVATGSAPVKSSSTWMTSRYWWWGRGRRRRGSWLRRLSKESSLVVANHEEPVDASLAEHDGQVGEATSQTPRESAMMAENCAGRAPIAHR